MLCLSLLLKGTRERPDLNFYSSDENKAPGISCDVTCIQQARDRSITEQPWKQGTAVIFFFAPRAKESAKREVKRKASGKPKGADSRMGSNMMPAITPLVTD